MIEYFIGAGDVHVAQLDANFNPLAFRNIGEAPIVEFNPTVEYAENWSTSKLGPNLQDLRVAIKNSAALMVTLKERTAKNLELYLYGETSDDVAGAYVANEAFPAGIVAGETYLIPGGHVGITNLVIKDSAGAPVTVAVNKYSVNPDAPFATFLDVAGFTQPFKAFSYNYVLSRKTTLLSKPSPELCVIFDGVNLAVPGERIWARFDRVPFGASEKFTLKTGSESGTGNAVDSYALQGPALKVPGRTSYGDYRQY